MTATEMATTAFGTEFAPFMATADFLPEEGWSAPRVEPLDALTLHPGTAVLHYGQSIFEGLKAFPRQAGHALFRVDQHAERFVRSARRMAMPPLDPALFVDACVGVAAAIGAQAEWAADTLYIRPVMFATDQQIGVRPSNAYRFCVIVSRSRGLFGDADALSMWVSHDYVRAAPGGTGAAKCSGNYAASLIGKQHAVEAGCDDVIWLDALERRYIEEAGTMNFVLVRTSATGRNTLVTPPPGETVLAGITRASILALAPTLGLGIDERAVSIDEWRNDARAGLLTEAFGCGTAAVVAPIGRVVSGETEWTMGDGRAGPVTTAVRDALVAIQLGTAPAPEGWLTAT